MSIAEEHYSTVYTKMEHDRVRRKLVKELADDGYPNSFIASVMCIPEGTVKTYLTSEK